MTLSDELERIHQLHREGALTEAEFADAKAQVLRQEVQPPLEDAEEPTLGGTLVLAEMWVRELGSHVVRLVKDRDFPELKSWKGTAQLGGLWFLLLIGCALTPVYALLRLPFRKGGWRFAVGFLGILVVIAVAAVIIVLASVSWGGAYY